jgi:hypothetical protein
VTIYRQVYIYSIIADFRLSPFMSVDVYSAVGCLHHVDVGSVADVSIHIFPPSFGMKCLWWVSYYL